MALACLTDAGRELHDDASGVVDDVLNLVLRRVDREKATLSDVLEELSRAP